MMKLLSINRPPIPRSESVRLDRLNLQSHVAASRYVPSYESWHVLDTSMLLKWCTIKLPRRSTSIRQLYRACVSFFIQSSSIHLTQYNSYWLLTHGRDQQQVTSVGLQGLPSPWSLSVTFKTWETRAVIYWIKDTEEHYPVYGDCLVSELEYWYLYWTFL